ncbi:MAG: tetratricopeptide repeat protein [Desulfobacteraceae bacterium]|nr:tetratricopeptide repeat protein [Desulfobacteraceae bacterium]
MNLLSIVALLLNIIAGMGTIFLFWHEKHKLKEEQNPKLILSIGIIVFGISLVLHPVISFYEKSKLPKPLTVDAIANAVIAKQKGYEKELQDQNDQIQSLKETIGRLQEDKKDKLKQKALKALANGNILEATTLMEEVAQASSKAIKISARQASTDWVDVGNIVYFSNTQKAHEAYQKAIDIDPSNPFAWNRLGHILIRLGQIDKAKQAYSTVLKLSTKNKIMKSIGYGNMGIVYQIRGDLVKALEMHNKSLAIDKELGRKEGIASDYSNIGIVYQTQGDLVKAREMYYKSLAIYKELGRKVGMALTYNYLGNVYQIQGDLVKAMEMYNKSLTIDKELGRKEGIASDYSNIGNVYQIQGDLVKAREMYNKSLAIDKELGRKVGMAHNYSNIGNVYQIQGDLVKAREMYNKSLAINKELGRKVGMAYNYGNMGNVYQIQGDLVKACKFWQTSLALCKSVGAKERITFVERLIKKFCENSGNTIHN